MNTISSLTMPTTTASSKIGIADCDLHLGPAAVNELFPWLETRWQTHIETFGMSHRTGLQNGMANFPKAQPAAARRDAWPPSGRPPGTDLDFTRAQHLDPNNIVFGLINPPTPSNSTLHPELGNALARAWNEWQLECLVRPEPRLKAAIVVNYEDTPAAVAEIQRCAGNPGFSHVQMLGRTAQPMGSRQYFPIFAAAAEANIPVATHAFGFSGVPNTSSGWGSYYIEDMVGHAQSCQAQLTSLIVNGVFARLPALKFVLIESGFGWVPSLAWRLDKHATRLRQEIPELTRLPSDYIRSQVWFSTQPMEEPVSHDHVLDTIAWIGWDRLLFATDYPHWDFDHPDHVLPARVFGEQRIKLLRDNALELFKPR